MDPTKLWKFIEFLGPIKIGKCAPHLHKISAIREGGREIMEGRRGCCRIKILMFPWLALGHITPFLQLAKELSLRNFHIYLCSTPVNLNFIKEKLLERNSHSIQLVELHLPSLPDLPPQYHTTNGLPPRLMPTLKGALHLAQHHFSEILRSTRPDLVIYDFIQDWVAVHASSLNIPAVQMLTTGTATIAYTFHFLQDPKNPASSFPFPEIFLRDHEMARITKMIDEASKEQQRSLDEKGRMLRTMSASSRVILVKTCREIEAKYIDHLSVLVGKRIMPVGLLVQEPDVVEDARSDITDWLDGKEELSSVYVSFGSEYFLSGEEMEEIAHGLELSGLNFIWVVRFPMGEDKVAKIEEALPGGFVERTRGRGMVVEGWAPQARILKHPSIGGFVSHCGWNSLMEGLAFGVPIVAMPMHLDQPINARLVGATGVGKEVIRDREGRLERNEIARIMKEVVVEKGGQGMRRRVRELGEIMKSRGKENIDGLVEELMQLHQHSL